jgi:hypothetical protein
MSDEFTTKIGAHRPLFQLKQPMPNLLMVINPKFVAQGHISDLVEAFSESAGACINVIETREENAPDIRIWDLDNIQNGDAIPPTIIEKLKEITSAA